MSQPNHRKIKSIESLEVTCISNILYVQENTLSLEFISPLEWFCYCDLFVFPNISLGNDISGIYFFFSDKWIHFSIYPQRTLRNHMNTSKKAALRSQTLLENQNQTTTITPPPPKTKIPFQLCKLEKSSLYRLHQPSSAFFLPGFFFLFFFCKDHSYFLFSYELILVQFSEIGIFSLL